MESKTLHALPIKVLDDQYFIAFIVDSSLFLFSVHSGKVYGFEDESAALFLQLYDECYILDNVALSNKFPNIPQKFIDQIYDIVMNSKEAETYSPPIVYPSHEYDPACRFNYKIANTLFQLHYHDLKWTELLDPIFSHLHSDSPPEVSSNIIHVNFGYNDGWHVLFNHTAVNAFPLNEEELPLGLYELMNIAAYQKMSYLIAIHSATLIQGDDVIMFPGLSGSGKTTLTAALSKQGYEILSDEVGIISKDARIHGLGMPMPIKEGGWKVIEDEIGLTLQNQRFKRWDGQWVRFLVSEKYSNRSGNIRMIVFPKYSQYGAKKIQRITPSKTLIKIKESGYQFKEPLNKNSFTHMINAIIGVPAYEIEYTSTQEALDIIQELWNG